MFDPLGRRASNRQTSPDLLRHYGVKFDTKNNGAHLVITEGDRVIDFWPGTGLWICRKTKRERRGVFGLLRTLGRKVRNHR